MLLHRDFLAQSVLTARKTAVGIVSPFTARRFWGLRSRQWGRFYFLEIDLPLFIRTCGTIDPIEVIWPFDDKKSPKSERAPTRKTQNVGVLCC